MVDPATIDLGNQENRHATVKDRENSNNRVTIVIDLIIVDLIDGVFANLLAHIFGSS